MRPAPQDIPKAEMFRSLGYGGSVAFYADVLEAAGLSNARKERIAESKRANVARKLAEHFFRVCTRGDCANDAPGRAAGRTVVPAATQADCEVCGGSRNRSAVDDMVLAFRDAGWERLVVVGGSPATREDLRHSQQPSRLRWPSTQARTLAAAKAD